MPAWLWLAFLLFVGALVALDLGVFHRRAEVISLPQALAWTAFWVAVALSFNGLVYYLYNDNTPAWLGISTVELSGARGGAAVPHRLRAGEVALRRQHLRHRHDLRLLPRARSRSSTACCSGASSEPS